MELKSHHSEESSVVYLIFIYVYTDGNYLVLATLTLLTCQDRTHKTEKLLRQHVSYNSELKCLLSSYILSSRVLELFHFD